MKKYTAYIVGISAILSIATPALAIEGSSQGASTTNTGSGRMIKPPVSEVRNTIKEIRDNAASTTREVREGAREEIKSVRVDAKLLQRARIAWIKMNATVVRLTKINTKLDSRINKIKTASSTVDVSVATKASTDAKTYLNKAVLDLNTIKSIISSGVSTSTQVATSTIQSAAKDAETQIKAAKEALEIGIKSLANLKINLENKENVSADTKETN